MPLAQGRSLHETKDMYVNTPAPTHDASYGKRIVVLGYLHATSSLKGGQELLTLGQIPSHVVDPEYNHTTF
jgi:hypothetical protein